MNRRQRGFTLIELMVALVVSSLLVGMILAIFSRMSLAYRGQQQIAGVQQVLAAARATIELDAKQAGLQMPQGFRFANDGGTAVPPVNVIDSSTGPDQIRFYYADATTQAVVTGIGNWPTSMLEVDSTAGFAVGERVVLSRARESMVSPVDENDARIELYDACVLEIQAVSPNALTFATAPPWGNGSPPAHCVLPSLVSPPSMIYKFVSRAYRIDTSTAARAALGPLQRSDTGGLLGLADNFEDIAYGFTDIQTALRFFEDADLADLDLDGDPERDWYSADGQQDVAITGAVTPIQVSISLVARTDREVEGIATAATPQLLMPGNINNNSLGNRASVNLPSTTDDALRGSHIYRHTTFQVDLRNLGVGR